MNNQMKMHCPKCNSTNLRLERPRYISEDPVLTCYVCGKRIYGEEEIEAEYKKQQAEHAARIRKQLLDRAAAEKEQLRQAELRRKEQDRIESKRQIALAKAGKWRGKVMVICEHCGVVVYKKKWDITKNISGLFYCSHSCNRAYLKKKGLLFKKAS